MKRETALAHRLAAFAYGVNQMHLPIPDYDEKLVMVCNRDIHTHRFCSPGGTGDNYIRFSESAVAAAEAAAAPAA